jgi:hypothetical protein
VPARRTPSSSSSPSSPNCPSGPGALAARLGLRLVVWLGVGLGGGSPAVRSPSYRNLH